MSQLILINDEHLIGDSLSMMPAFHALRDRWDGDAFLHMGNEAVRTFVKPYGFKRLDEIPEGTTKAKVIRSSAMRAFQQYVYTHHMAQAHFGIVGLPVPNEVPVVPVQTESVGEAFEYVIAPWSKSDDNHNKLWYEDRWADVFAVLHSACGHPLEPKIAILGADGEARPAAWWQRYNEYVTFRYGKPLSYVAGLMVRARAVITIDNGISHIARMLGIKNHVLLYPECLPPQWVGNPNSITIRGEPRNITAGTVIRILKDAGLV